MPKQYGNNNPLHKSGVEGSVENVGYVEEYAGDNTEGNSNKIPQG